MTSWTTPGIAGDIFKQQELSELAELIDLPAERIPDLSRALERAAGLHIPFIQQSDGPGPAEQRVSLLDLASGLSRLIVQLDELDEKSRHELLLEYRGYIPAYETYLETIEIRGKQLKRRMVAKHARTSRERFKADKAYLRRLNESLLAAAAALARKRGRPSIEHVEYFVQDLVSVFVGFTGAQFKISGKQGKDLGCQFVRRAVEIAYPGVPAKTIGTAMTRAVARQRALERRAD